MTALAPGDTPIVLTSDRGEMLGERRLWAKTVALEPSARVPFLIASPSDLGTNSGATIPAVATTADVFSTVLELAGIHAPSGGIDGRSLAPLLRGETQAVRDVLHIEHAPRDHPLTDGRWKHIRHCADGSGPLLDLAQDPQERQDLARAGAAADEPGAWRSRTVEDLRGRPGGSAHGDPLVPGRPSLALLPHGGNPSHFSRSRFGQARPTARSLWSVHTGPDAPVRSWAPAQLASHGVA